MLMNPMLSFMLMTLILSTLMTLMSPNWLTMWVMLEINMLSFIPLMMSSKSNQETEAAIKYFLSQATGSMLMLTGSFMLYQTTSSKTLASMILLSSLLIKLGAAPCHFWYPSVMTSLSWMNCLFLSTWQKIAPLFLMLFLMNMESEKTTMSIIAAMGAMVGGIMGLNQTHLRTIMAYSSISHLSWMIALFFNKTMSILYFCMYVIIISPLFIIFSMKNKKSALSLYNFQKMNPIILAMMILLLLSLGGLPPLTGFIPKLMAITSMMDYYFMTTLILIMGSLMNLYYYLNISFSMILSSTFNSMSHEQQTSPLILIVIKITAASCMLGILPTLLYK